MSLLDESEVPEDGAIICTITGDAGMGKTRLAAAFPKPYFVRIEDGMKSIPRAERPKATPLIETPDQLWQYITALIKEKHDYRTLVVDSVTQLDTLFTNHVVETDPKKPKSIATALGGYGAGFQAVSALHGRLRKACGILNKQRGMNIVFIAHSETITIELPDQEPYTKYDIRMNKKSVSHYTDNVDLVGHIRLETFTRGEEGQKKKAISDGTRQLVCYAGAAQVSKNRFGIIEDLIVPEGENPLADYIAILGSKEHKQAVKKAAKVVDEALSGPEVDREDRRDDE